MSPALREHPEASDPPSGLPEVSLEEARAALEEGRLEVALAAARAALDGTPERRGDRGRTAPGDVAGHAAWTALRDGALAAVRLAAEEHRRRGQPAVAARWLGLLLRHDARAAHSVHLAWDRPAGGARGHSSSALGAAAAVAGSDAPEPAARGGDLPRAAPRIPGAGALALGAAPRFRWAIDAAGDFLCVVADEVVLAGHGGDAPRLVRRPALTGGGAWCLLAPPDGATVDGRTPRRAGQRLRSGARVELVAAPDRPAVAFTFRADDPSTAAARLELERGVDADDAQGLVLLDVGREGRATVGPNGHSLIRCAELDEPLELWIGDGDLWLRAPRAGERRRGAAPRAEPFAAGRALGFGWPLEGRCDVELAPTGVGRPPLWMRLEPC